MKQIMIKSQKPREVINITPLIEQLLEKHPAKDGMIHLFLRHNTAALTAAYIGDEIDLGMIGGFETMLPHGGLHSPQSLEHTHHVSHLPAHIIGAMLGPYLAVPVKKNKLMLGTFQSIVLVELNGPLERELIVVYG